MYIKAFTFNPFAENTYLLYDDTKECVIIDPGCYTATEQKMLTDFIESGGLKPVKLVNTHCHIDHVCGNAFVSNRYKLELGIHPLDKEILERAPASAQMFGISIEPSPDPSYFLEEGQQLSFGESSLDIFFTPGHSPGSIVFYSAAQHFLIGGDVLFERSIGRTDLYKGDFDTLAASIREKLYVLPDETVVLPGHGNPTSIGQEKAFNPFVRA